MIGGRKPKPSRLKILEGNAGKRPLPKREPKVIGLKSPEPPKPLSRRAKMHWRKLVPQLQAVGLIGEIDRDAMGMYCEAQARWSEANQEIQKNGVIVVSPQGFPMQSPYLAISNKAFEQMRQLLPEFGMTPSSRTRIETPADLQPDNPFSRFSR